MDKKLKNLLETFLKEDLAKQLNSIVKKTKPCTDPTENVYQWDTDNYSLQLSVTRDGAYFLQYVIYNAYNKQINKDFKKYLENLDDDLFIAASNIYNTYYGNLKALNESIENDKDCTKQILNFKNCVHKAVEDKILSLTETYLKTNE